MFSTWEFVVSHLFFIFYLKHPLDSSPPPLASPTLDAKQGISSSFRAKEKEEKEKEEKVHLRNLKALFLFLLLLVFCQNPTIKYF